MESQFYEWVELIRRLEDREIVFNMLSAEKRWNALTPDEQLAKVVALRRTKAKADARERKLAGYRKAKRLNIPMR